MPQTLAASRAAGPPRAHAPEDIARLARALTLNGHGADLCYWQNEDTETWKRVGAVLESWGVTTGAHDAPQQALSRHGSP